MTLRQGNIKKTKTKTTSEAVILQFQQFQILWNHNKMWNESDGRRWSRKSSCFCRTYPEWMRGMTWFRASLCSWVSLKWFAWFISKFFTGLSSRSSVRGGEQQVNRKEDRSRLDTQKNRAFNSSKQRNPIKDYASMKIEFEKTTHCCSFLLFVIKMQLCKLLLLSNYLLRSFVAIYAASYVFASAAEHLSECFLNLKGSFDLFSQPWWEDFLETQMSCLSEILVPVSPSVQWGGYGWYTMTET